MSRTSSVRFHLLLLLVLLWESFFFMACTFYGNQWKSLLSFLESLDWSVKFHYPSAFSATEQPSSAFHAKWVKRHVVIDLDSKLGQVRGREGKEWGPWSSPLPRVSGDPSLLILAVCDRIFELSQSPPLFFFLSYSQMHLILTYKFVGKIKRLYFFIGDIWW